MPDWDSRIKELDQIVSSVVKALRERDWKLLALQLAAGLLLNPNVLAVFFIKPSLWYKLTYWVLVSVLLLVAVTVQLRKRPSTPDIDPLAHVSKGLYAYTQEDRAVFQKLERGLPLRECRLAVSSGDFYFGVLSGPSGCGKTSFLQAALKPELSDIGFECIYVKVTNEDLRDTLTRALVVYGVPRTDEVRRSLIDLLTALDGFSKPAVLILDQFEQFFSFYRRKQDRLPLIHEMAQWYRERLSRRTKLLISIRDDFGSRLIELQKVIGYSLGPQDNLVLEEFTVDQATRVISTICELEDLPYDRDFLKIMAKADLADSESELISPVDVQILTWMVRSQSEEGSRAFTRSSYKLAGGMEGILQRFLSRSLRALTAGKQRENAVKVLLALTDLENNTRAGRLSLDEIVVRLNEAIRKSDVEEALIWLSAHNVRLVSTELVDEEVFYELAHERLIGALRKLAGVELSLAGRAQNLLDRRVNEWIASGRSNRYAFNFWELRQIRTQRPFLAWGASRADKEALLAASTRRVALHACTLVAGIGIIAFPVYWWFGPVGEVWTTRRELLALATSGQASLPALILSVRADISNGWITDADTIFNKMAEGYEEALQSKIAAGLALFAATRGDVYFSKVLELEKQLEEMDVSRNRLASIISALQQLDSQAKSPFWGNVEKLVVNMQSPRLLGLVAEARYKPQLWETARAAAASGKNPLEEFADLYEVSGGQRFWNEIQSLIDKLPSTAASLNDLIDLEIRASHIALSRRRATLDKFKNVWKEQNFQDPSRLEELATLLQDPKLRKRAMLACPRVECPVASEILRGVLRDNIVESAHIVDWLESAPRDTDADQVWASSEIHARLIMVAAGGPADDLIVAARSVAEHRLVEGAVLQIARTARLINADTAQWKDIESSLGITSPGLSGAQWLVRAWSRLDVDAFSKAVQVADLDRAAYPINEELARIAIFLSQRFESTAPLTTFLLANPGRTRGVSLTELTEAACSLGAWRLARRFADFAGDDDKRIAVLAAMLTMWSKAPVAGISRFASRYPRSI